MTRNCKKTIDASNNEMKVKETSVTRSPATSIEQHRNAVTKYNLEKSAVTFVHSEAMFEGMLTQKELYDVESEIPRRNGFVLHKGANGAKIGDCAFVT